MQYLTDDQMKNEKPLKEAYSKKNNALEKYLKQCSQMNSFGKNTPGRRVSIFYAPRRNQVVVIN
ncbi:MAG: hypothetical protein EHM58_01540 [Ignavibacteriae bacterium]|nr:MAG: hypothetical protein EHM58_01540 [Ignavibacteriota bacterium]